MEHVIGYDYFLCEGKVLKSNDGKPSTEAEMKDAILRMKSIPKEWKEEAVKFVTSFDGKLLRTEKRPSQVTGLTLHPDLKKKIKEKNLPSGFDMGIDKDGYFIHTHRAKSKSYDDAGKISVKDIKFIDSTG